MKRIIKKPVNKIVIREDVIISINEEWEITSMIADLMKQSEEIDWIRLTIKRKRE